MCKKTKNNSVYMKNKVFNNNGMMKKMGFKLSYFFPLKVPLNLVPNYVAPYKKLSQKSLFIFICPA